MIILVFCIIAELNYVKDVQKVIDFANYLYETGNYESAITEYERVIFLCFHQDTSTPQIDTSGGDTLSVRLRWSRRTSPAPAHNHMCGTPSGSKEFSQAIFLQIGRCYLSLDDYKTARKYLNYVENDTSYALIGFSLLDECSSGEAESVFIKIRDKSWQSKIETHCSKLRSLPYKSPLIAGFSSAILPGSGRAYSGRLGDGIFSLIFTVGSAALAYHYYEADNRWASIGFGGLSLLFYLGDIYGSVEAAKLHNEKLFYDELDKFKSDFGYPY